MAEISAPSELGAAIRRARRSQRLRLEDVALAAGTGIRFVSELERGKTTARLAETMRVMQAVGLTMDVSGPGSDFLPREPRLEEIHDAVARVFAIDPASLIGRDRGPLAVRARRVAMYLAREHTAATLAEIGHYFGGRTADAALASHRWVGQEMKARPGLRRAIDQTRTLLRGERP